MRLAEFAIPPPAPYDELMLELYESALRKIRHDLGHRVDEDPWLDGHDRDSADGPELQKRYLRNVWIAIQQELAASSAKVYLYGAGAHTRRLLDLVADLPRECLAAILDDRPTVQSIGDIPVRLPDVSALKPGSIVLLSSDRHEATLHQKALQNFGGMDVRILRLYERVPAGALDPAPDPEQIRRRLDAVCRARKYWGGTDFVGPYEMSGSVLGFLQEQRLWHYRAHITGRVLDMSTPFYWHMWIRELPEVDEVIISDLDSEFVVKGGYVSRVDVRGDFCATKPPAPPETFDTVLCLNIIEHCTDPQRMLANLHEVLTPGGSLLLIAPFAYVDGHCRPDYWRFPAEGLALLAERAGYATFEAGGLGDVGGMLESTLAMNLKAAEGTNGIPLVTWLHATKRSWTRQDIRSIVRAIANPD